MPKLSAILHHLYALLDKNRPWKWGSKEREAFQKRKQKLLESKFLTHYDLKRPVSLSCDASPYGVSACLTHIMPDGEERPIAFASRTLLKAEKEHPQLEEKEALALVYGVKQFYKYLVGREVLLFTDHRPLLKILELYEGVPTLAAARLQRWALLLSAYNYKLKFKSGVDNKEADLLSRLPIPMQVICTNEEIYHVDYCDQLPVTATKIARETQKDPILRKAYEYTRDGWRTLGNPCLEPYARRSTELSIDNGCLLWGSRVIIPGHYVPW